MNLGPLHSALADHCLCFYARFLHQHASFSFDSDVVGRPSVAKAWRDTFAAHDVQAFLYPGSAVTVQ